MDISKKGVFSPGGILRNTFSFFSDGFSITLDANSKTQKQCIRNIEHINLIARGTESGVYSLGKNTKYILRISLKIGEKYNNEILFSSIASSSGFGPRLYDEWLCEVKLLEKVNDIPKGIHMANFMILEKYDITLRDWLIKYGKKYWLKEKDYIISYLRALIKKMHKENINHNDLHTENVMMRNSGEKIDKIVIIDFGRSTHRGSVNYKDEKILASTINDILGSLDIPDRLNYKEFV